MADRIFENVGEMDGTYAGAPFLDSESSILEVTLADVPFLKTANQSIWFSGQLTVTLEADNRQGEGPLEPTVIRDYLDNTKFNYIADSVVVTLTDTTATPETVTVLTLDTDYTVAIARNVETGKDLLTVTIVAGGRASSIPVGSKLAISFRGSKVPA